MTRNRQRQEKKLHRAEFFAPDADTPDSSVWVEVLPPGALKLQHDYPDFPAQRGWAVVVNGETRQVASIEGRTVTLV